ncbi:MAG TPA: hypothetical protein VG992_00045 [Candidatus Saccharimonadales bacterium]|nr:hypothetical protein [Candidatus Saccharimonadales bacterium]
MAASDKDTIYIDIDDEITGIIDKLRSSSGKVVALVLPKRAAVFQSIVNMKLLKRAADDAKKNLVLITTEAGLLPLAGAAGVYVARTLTSKPEIPSAPSPDDGHEEEVDEAAALTTDDAEVTTATAGSQPVGALAGLPTPPPPTDDVETVELDNADEDTEVPTRDFTPPVQKDKKLHVPNFERFRLLLVIGGALLLLLIIGAIFAFKVLPSATINIKTDATNVDANLNLSLSTTATSLDPATNTVPAKLVKQQKTYTEEVPTTGQKNEGEKASGSVTMTACESGFSLPQPIPAGTGITSSGGQTYITQTDTSFSSSGSPKGNCFEYHQIGTTEVVAIAGGSSYNTGNGTDFSVSGRSDTSASGAASGGTDKNVQVVSQSDINDAKSKVNTKDPTIQQSLENQLTGSNYFAVNTTFHAGTPSVKTSANVGDPADDVTVTETITYTMLGVQQSDLKTLVDNFVKKQIDTSKQSILSEGIDTATFNVESQNSKGAELTMAATAEAGPQLDVAAIKRSAAGKKSGDVKSELETNPDVTSVDITYSPFWVSSVPTNTGRITVNVAKPTTTANTNRNGDNP